MEVKGLAEREAAADLALWPLRFVASAGDLATDQAPITRGTEAVLAFLERHGIGRQFTELQNLRVSDSNTDRFQQPSGPRFVIEQTVMVRLTEPQIVQTASQRVSELVSAGVVLSSSGEFGVGGPTFVFTNRSGLVRYHPAFGQMSRDHDR